MTPRGTRLDQALVDRGLVANRSRARALVMAGKVRVGGHPATKAGMPVSDADELSVADEGRFVGRGGDKLDAALAASDIEPAGRVCLDIGASTGGFTDRLLQGGAAVVVAVDVGYGQLDWRLRGDDRVRLLERTNARHLTPDALPDDLPSAPDVLVADVSFIGLAKILPAAGELCGAACDALLLVKPQFEAGPDEVGRGGLVTDGGVRREALRGVGDAAEKLGWQVVAAIPSPLRGAAGNWECFLQLRRPRREGEAVSLDAVLDAIEIPSG